MAVTHGQVSLAPELQNSMSEARLRRTPKQSFTLCAEPRWRVGYNCRLHLGLGGLGGCLAGPARRALAVARHAEPWPGVFLAPLG